MQHQDNPHNFIVSARKYRPITFDSVVGQHHITDTLKNAIKEDRLAHAFLFCGPRGVGKTTCARILAKVLNCTNRTPETEPCGHCDSCLAFEKNASLNIHELDAASNNSVEHIRSLIEQVRFAPQQGKYKIYIIDEVHMLTTQAFNAFLKTLEEPPPYAKFILATTEKHKIIPTILSRCQIFDFRRIQVADMSGHLQRICNEEGITATEDALGIISQKADGGLRDALSIFDRIVGIAGKNITYKDVVENLNILDYEYYFKIVDGVLTEDLAGIMLSFNDVLDRGFEGDLFLNGLAEHFRNLMVCKYPNTTSLLEVSGNIRERYQQQSAITPLNVILSALAIINDCDVNYKTARHKRLHVEMALMRMAYITRIVDASKVVEKKTSDLTNTSSVVGERASDYTKIDVKPEVNIAKTPSLKGLEMLKKEVEAASKQVKAANLEVTLESIQTQWATYAESLTSPSARQIFNSAELSFANNVISIVVSSTLAQETLRENNPIAYLKEKLGAHQLFMEVVVDKSKAPVIETERSQALTVKEVYAKLNELNPALSELQKKFDLRLDVNK